MRIKQDLRDYLDGNIEAIAESHIETWKERYYGYTKRKLAFDLEINHDDSLEIEDAEWNLKRKLSDGEKEYLIRQFHKEVIKQFVQDI